MQVFHDKRCTDYGQSGHPERPERILQTVPLLQQRHSGWQWIIPPSATREELLRAHSPEYLRQITTGSAEFDSDCPAYPGIFEHAARSAGSAIAAARLAVAGDKAFSLMRPPGHHALRERAMGFCYFSNVALAALDAIERGVERIAIWDFDAHHGNGTEALVANNPSIIFASIHQYPGWPGTGTKSFGNIHNLPIAPYSARQEHVSAVEQGFKLLLAFKPDLVLVSAGFDAYFADPITQMTLTAADFAHFGDWLRQARVPAAAVLEGGYSDELPELIDAFLSAWDA